MHSLEKTNASGGPYVILQQITCTHIQYIAHALGQVMVEHYDDI